MYFLGILQDVGDAIYQGIRTLLGYLMAVIYTLIEFFYEVFEIVSRAEILRNEFVQDIYYRVGLILGLFMIFKLTFSLIQSLIDPDKINDKKNGVLNIVKRSIISIILLGSTPYIFSEAMAIQKLVIGTDASDNILYKLITNNKTNSVGKTGEILATDLYFEFFRDDENPKIDEGVQDFTDTCIGVSKGDYCNRFVVTTIDTIKKDVKDSNLNFFDTVAYLSLKENDSNDYVIEFDWGGLLGIIVGAFVLYMIFMYCVQTAIRVIQLAYLQLIAPIPILSYISNPDGSFKNWGSQCISTYLDLFIRLIIIYFTMTMINEVLVMIGDSGSILMTSTGLSGSDNFILKLTVKIFIILGLLLFAQKAPDLIKEIFPGFGGSGKFSFGLGFKKNFSDPLKASVKSLYDSPLGWAPKLVKKGFQAYDRKKYNLVKSRGKLGQKIDEILPGRAAARKSSEEARNMLNESRKLENQGKGLFDAHGKDLPSSVFKNSEYRKSYNDVAAAKEDAKNSGKALRDANLAYSAAYNSGDQAAISRARAKLNDAESRDKIAQARLEKAKEKHERLKSIYTNDARIENAHSYFKDRNPEYVNRENNAQNYNNNSPTESNHENLNSSPSMQEPAPSVSPQVKEGPSPMPFSEEAEENAYNELMEVLSNGSSEEEVRNKLEAYENVRKSRQDLDNDLDDFYDRMNDGYGGQ